MDFFAIQSAARRRSVLLVLYYAGAVLAVIPLVYLVVLGAAVPVRATYNFFGAWYDFDGAFTPSPHPGWWDASLFAWVAVSVLILMLGGTVYRLREVSRGGYVIAELLGGERLPSNTADPARKRLLNVVEEMALASGLPVPDVYVLRAERGINAFAAGMTPDDAVIGVTQGAVDMLSRDELQGVVAHEFSHLLYGDTRLKTILIGLLYGLVYLGLLSNRACLQAVKGEPATAAAAFFVFVVLGFFTIPLLLAAQIGLALAGAIKCRVSRQREFLADAAAVQFTRNPGGVAGALRKIGGYVPGSALLVAGAGEASHFFFAGGLRSSFQGLFGLALHPRLADRVRRLDPGFSGEFEYVPSRSANLEKAAGDREVGPAGTETGFSVQPDRVSGSIGDPGAEHVALAAALLASIPADLDAALRDPAGARGVIYALLLSRDPDARRKQCELLARSEGAAVMDVCRRATTLLEGLKSARRLPLAAVAVHSLKELPREEGARFRGMVNALIAADGRMDVFEFALQKMVLRHAIPAREGKRHAPVPVRYRTPESLEALAKPPATLRLTACVAGRFVR